MIRIALIAVGTFLVGILVASVTNSTNMTKLQNENDKKIATLTQELANTHASLADALKIPERPTESLSAAVTSPELEDEFFEPIDEPLEPEPDIPLEAEIDVAGAVDERRGRGNRERPTAEMFQEMRERYMGAMDEMWENADTETQERITAIVDYQEEMFEIGQQMRNAETDEERTEVRETMRENMRNMQLLVREQQNAMLGEVVGEFGISDPKLRKDFTNALRETMSSPLYNVGSGRGGGGFSGRGGFPGGAGRRGGGEGGSESGGGRWNTGGTQQ